MVMRLFLFFACLLPVVLVAQETTPVRVFADLDSDIFENAPIMGTLSIEHPEDAKIEKKSIQIKNVPLTAERLKEVRYSPNDPLTLTIYRFQLPAREKGLYALEEISVMVGGKIYTTIPSSFEVKKKKPSLEQQQGALAPGKQKTSKPVFVLEAFVEPNRTLYPGQRTKVGYRYYFNRSIEASKEVLPLLEAEGFKKVGGKIARTAQNDDLSLLEVSQEIEATKPGEYTFGPSYFEGIASDADGQQILPALKGEAEIIKITVVELPQNVKPPSYKNAIGHYAFETKLDSTPNVEVGEKMLLRVIVSGAPLEDVELPDLCCQPGMAGRFHFSDIPPPAIMKEKSIQFVVDIRPMDAEIREIPVLEFSFFNPEKGVYERVHSNTIPVKVKAIVLEEEKKVALVWPKMELAPQPVTIEGFKELSPPNPLLKLLLSWWGLLTLPLAAGLIYFQIGLKKTLDEYWLKQQRQSSLQLLNSLNSCQKEELPSRLKECFLQRLIEIGALDAFEPYEELSDEGAQGMVKAFLLKVDAWHYAESADSSESLIQEARALYGEIHHDR